MLPGGSVAMDFGVPRGGYSQYRTIEELRAAESWFVVHILGEDGQIRFSMDETRRNEGGTPFRQLEIAPDGSLLSTRTMEYRIDRWDPATGVLLETFVRDADWWPEDNEARIARPDTPPVTSVSDMHVDEAGRMWLYINRPAPDWRDHLERTEPNPEWPAGGYRYGPGASESVIEVVDMGIGASAGVAGDGHAPGATDALLRPRLAGRLRRGSDRAEVPDVPRAAGGVGLVARCGIRTGVIVELVGRLATPP